MANEIQPITTSEGEIVLYQPDENISLEVKLDAAHETVWLTRQQMATLFGRDVKTIGKHINNALREELSVSVQAKNDQTVSVVAKNAITAPIASTVTKNATFQTANPVVVKFATTASDGKVYQIEHYSLDMILSVGYRVHSPQGILFRTWANNVLKQYLLQGYTVNHQLIALQERIDSRFTTIEQTLQQHEQQINFFVRTNQPPHEGVVFEGHLLEGRQVAEALIKSATTEVILIDGYVGADTFHILETRAPGVQATIYTDSVGPRIQSFQADHESEYGTTRHIEVRKYRTDFHDRFLIIDDDVYHFGASLKDLGKRLFAFDKMGLSKALILSQV